MVKNINKLFSYLSIAFLLLFLQGCTDERQEEANRVNQNNAVMLGNLDQRFEVLTKHIKSPVHKGKYERTLEFAIDQIEREKHDFDSVKDLTKQFKKDMTIDSVLYKSIKEDYDEVKSHRAIRYIGMSEAPKEQLGAINNLSQELARLTNAMKPEVYDEQYIDYINIIAQLTPNVKPVITPNVDKDAPFGSQFVGNPNYGEWVTNDQGQNEWSFWATYGFISFIDDLFFDNHRKYRNCSYYQYKHYDSNCNRSRSSRIYTGSYGYWYDYDDGYRNKYRNGSRYRYDNWKNNRNYSYYNDVYADKYASQKKRVQHTKYTSNLNKKYKSSIRKNTTLESQNKSISKTHKKYSSNLLAKKPKSNNRNNSPDVRQSNKPTNNKPK